MKKTLFIISVLIITALSSLAQQNIPCCPDFTIDNLTGIGKECCMSCDNSLADTSNTGGGVGQGYACRTSPLAVCKNSYGQFVVYPNLPGFTYQWTITGGTPATIANGNPVTILWGNGTTGSITVVINGPGCTKTITRAICMLDKPIANFTYSPLTNICTGTYITFTNTSSGAASYTWLFGDGTSSQLPNPPPHQYTVANTYTVTLIVSSNGGGNPNNPALGGNCGCVDTIKKTIVVGSGPGIETCSKMICPGDTVKYCSTITTCPPYNWLITGAGNIIVGPSNQSCVNVVWNGAPGSLQLTSGCTPCNSTTITPNVIWPILPYTGLTTVCVGSTNTYSVPTIPGTFYSWSISPAGATILNGGPNYPNNYPVNNPMVNVNFSQPGTYTLVCNYNNPNTKKNCGGTTTIIINAIPKFTVKGLTTFCQNTSGVFSTADGSNAIWTVTGQAGGFAPPAFPNGSSINVNWLLPGTYVLTAVPVIGANYCNPAGVTISIKVKPTPILSFVTPQTLICPNTLTNYTVTSNLPGNISWLLLSGTGSVFPFGANNTSASVQFSGLGPWTLQASQTVDGCVGNTTVNIAAVPPPPAITLSAATICSGGIITASVPPSIPPGGYTWSCTPGAVLTGAQGGLSTTFTVNSNATIMLTSCGGTTTINVTTTPATVTITKTNISCAAILTATPGGGTYNWFLNGNPFGSGSPITINQNGTYVVEATYPGGCKAINQIVVTGITPVTTTISGTGNLCTGAVTLTASVSANCIGGTFLWSNALTGNPITVTTPGSYSVTVTCPNNGCTAVSNVIVVQPCDTTNGVPCINDLVISPSNCPNPVALTTNIPAGCTPTGTAWYYGDGFSGNTGNHLYSNVGNYTVLAVMTCANGTKHCGIQNITVPMVDSFTYVVTCNPPSGWKVLLQDASIYLPAYAGYSITWTTSCGSLSNPNIPNPTLTVTVGCNPTITLTISKNGCTLIKTFTFNFPTSPFTILGNTNPCKNVDYVYSSSFTTGVIAYAWNFGDGTSGVTNPITHHFNGTPVNPTITLTITDQWNCQLTTSQLINVITPPALTITPSPLVKICPNCQPPVTLSTSPITGFTGYQWYQNGAAIGGANSSTYSLCNNAAGNYYVKATSNTGPCPVTSDTVMVVYNPLPDAVIHPRTIQCVSNFPSAVTNIYSGASFNPNYTYTWYLNNTGNQIFTSTTTNYLTYTVPDSGCYVFIVKVKDNITGCMAYDTACICFSQNPTVNILPTGSFCAGTPVSFIATAGPLPPAFYYYVWQDGTPGQNYTTSFAGIYTVTASNKYGCTSSASTVIKPLPYVELFPQGCDTLCDTAHLYFPIPQTTFGTPSYTITWYEGVNVIGTGFSIPIIGLGLGAHTIHATVVMNGCTAITAKLYLFIKHCGCDCKESHWGDIVLNDGIAKAGPLAGISAQQSKMANDEMVGNIGAQKLKCNQTYKLDCNKPVTINATYFCKDTSCQSKVTYSLLLPDNTIQTGTVAFTFTPALNGIYVLTLYGWCGGKICDSCKIKFDVNCIPCVCKGSKWGEKTVTINNIAKPFNCNDSYEIKKCNQPVTINAIYNCAEVTCNAAVTYKLIDPSGTTTGTLPLTFTPVLNGTYTVTLYGWCGSKICDSCKITFKVDCPPPPCCPYESPNDIKVTGPTVQLSTITNPNATVANSDFGITGPAGNLFTEIRAEVMSYDLFSNFNNECLSCKTFPYTWASIYKAGNVGAITPKITMYNSFVSSFNPAGNGMYQNPREVSWTSTNPFALPNNINIQFLLPSASIIDCCELTAKICVKFTFRNSDCKECEVITCFTVVIKPAGGHEDPQACNCNIKPVISYEGNNNKPVSCGETINLFAGNIPVNLNPGFDCKDQNGKDCAGSSVSVTIAKPDNTTQVLTGPNYSYTYNLILPGIYEYTITGSCGGKKCDCKFKVNIPK